VTGLIYVETGRTNATGRYNLVDRPLNRLTETELRPPRESIEKINSQMF